MHTVQALTPNDSVVMEVVANQGPKFVRMHIIRSVLMLCICLLTLLSSKCMSRLIVHLHKGCSLFDAMLHGSEYCKVGLEASPRVFHTTTSFHHA